MSPAKILRLVVPAVAAAFASLPSSADAANVQVGGYSLSTYASGLNLSGYSIAGLTIDPASRTLYFMPDTSGPLRSLNTSLTLTTLAPSPVGYPYISTDIEYYNGHVYMAYQNLVRFDAAAATSTVVTALPGTIEAGIARVGNLLYISGGSTNPGIMRTFDLSTNTLNTVPFPVPVGASSLEYDAVHNRLIVAENTNNGGSTAWHIIDLNTNTLSPAFATLSPSAFGNFAVDPTGTYIFARSGNNIDRIEIATGANTAFLTGLAYSSGIPDSVFGQSSSGNGMSLYVADGTSILEVSGFPAAVPEPASLSLLAIAAIPLLARRRRTA